MKSYFSALGIVALLGCGPLVFSQANQEVVAATQTWPVKKNKGLLGLAKPDFGPYYTIALTRVDSPVHRRKIKDKANPGPEVSVSDEGINVTKVQTIAKEKYYTLQLRTPADTTEALFEIIAASKQRKQTLLGVLLSKKTENTDAGAVLSYSRDVSGRIKTGRDTTWQFFIANFTSGGRRTEEEPWPHASLASVYLKNDRDSFYTKPSAWQSPDVVLYNGTGQELAMLEFRGNTASIRISKDVEPFYEQAIATLFAVIIAIKDA